MLYYCAVDIDLIIRVSIVSNKDQFLDLLLPINDWFVRHVEMMVKDKEEARDICGEAILIALQQIESLRDDNAFKAYLFKIARRTYVRVYWKKKFFIPLTEEHMELECDAIYPAESQFDVDVLHKSISRLPLKQREAISLYELGGMSLEEIREVQGGTLSGVKSRLARAREALQAMLSENS
jgi:RNA polymerase sigma-70 factor, ECF subfamily